MLGYVLRRIGISIIIVIGVSIVVFLMLHFVFGSPARVVLGPKATAAAIKVWNAQHGFDAALPVQYGRYINGVIHGNLGFSYVEYEPVTTLLNQRWARSLFLAGVSLLFAVVIAIPLGIYQAIRRNSLSDTGVTGIAFVLYSMPVFFLGLILIQVFAFDLPIFSFEGSQATSMLGVMADWGAMTLPIATLALIQVAQFSRYMRSSAMDVLAQDYIKVARAKGLPERLVMLRHLLRNAMLPIITLIGLSIPLLLAGNIIVEELFNYPGLGLLFYQSLEKEDYKVLLAYTLIAAVLTVVGNLIADLSLAAADPRIRLA